MRANERKILDAFKTAYAHTQADMDRWMRKSPSTRLWPPERLTFLQADLARQAKALRTLIARDARKRLTDSAETSAELSLRGMFDVPDDQIKRYLPKSLKGISMVKRMDLVSRDAVVATLGRRAINLSPRLWRTTATLESQALGTLAAGIATGRDPRRITRDLRAGLQSLSLKPTQTRGAYRRAFDNYNRIARTESSRSWWESAIKSAKQTKYNLRWTLSSAHSSLKIGFDICDSYANQDLYGIGNGVYPPNAYPTLPHPHCLAPDTRVVPGTILAAMRTRYSGEIVTLRFASGQHLTITPNHKVLSATGFKAAIDLRKGDQLLRAHTAENPMITTDPNNRNRPPTVKEIFETHRIALGMTTTRVPVTAEHFHGDGKSAHGEIDIISANSFLGSDAQANEFESLSDRTLVVALKGTTQLMGESELDSMLLALRLAADSSVSRLDHVISLDTRQLSPSNPLSLTPPSELDTLKLKSTSENSSRAIGNLRKLQDRLAGMITLDQITEIDVQFFDGHVFDLSCASGMYIANGIVSHNCMCYPIPEPDFDAIIAGRAPRGPTRNKAHVNPTFVITQADKRHKKTKTPLRKITRTKKELKSPVVPSQSPAISTGIEKIDSAINNEIKAIGSTAIGSCDAMTGKCMTASRSLAQKLDGLKILDEDGDLSSTVEAYEIQLFDPPSKTARYEMSQGHYVVLVEAEGTFWVVDLTAAQFGRKGPILVESFTRNIDWQDLGYN